MIAEAWNRVARGIAMPGLLVIPQDMPIGQTVRELEMLVLASEPDDWRNRVVFRPDLLRSSCTTQPRVAAATPVAMAHPGIKGPLFFQNPERVSQGRGKRSHVAGIDGRVGICATPAGLVVVGLAHIPRCAAATLG